MGTFQLHTTESIFPYPKPQGNPPNRGILTEMYPVYFRCLFHRWLRTSPPSPGVLPGSVVPGASASVFVVSTSIRKERWVDCLIFQEPCDDAWSLRVLKVPSWKGVGSVPDTHEARE